MGHVAQYGRLPTIHASDNSAEDYSRIFAGYHQDETIDARPELSLHQSCLIRKGVPMAARRYWDIDAVFLPLHSLGAHRDAFRLVYCPAPPRAITANWHFRLPGMVSHPARCAHAHLGRGLRSSGFATVIFFPRLPPPARIRGNHYMAPMVQDVQRQWVDDFLIPALREVVGSEVLSYHPRSWSEAKHRARARQALSTTGTDRSFVELGYDVPDDIGDRHGLLHRFWRVLEHRLANAGDSKWHGAQLVTFTYGCKLQHRSTQLAQLRLSFQSHLQDVFHEPQLALDATYVDLAYEDVAETRDGEALVLVRRSACNEADMRQLGLAARAQYFQWHGTADGSAVRAEPAVKSTIRSGGLAYVQAYMTEKDLWVNPERSTAPLFGESAYRNLGFSRAMLQDLYKTKGSRLAHDPDVRRRALSSLKAAIVRTGNTLDLHATDASTTFPCRQEFRVVWDLFLSAEIEDTQPVLADGHHWPFYALRKDEVCDFVRWDVNRWLTAICTTLTPPQQCLGRWAPLSAEDQHCRTAMLSMLFSCLELSVNSDCLALSSRLAHDRYARPRRMRLSAPAKLWKPSKNARVQLSEESGSTGSDSDPGTSRGRRGLALTSSLSQTGMMWLPFEAFSWDEMLFDPAFLRQTAFVNGHFLRQFGRSVKVTRRAKFRELVAEVVDRIPPYRPQSQTWQQEKRRLYTEVCKPLWHLCYFCYSNWLLTQLEAQGHISFRRLTPAERRGCYGLSYGLIQRAQLGAAPAPQFTRGGGGQSSGTGGFSSFPNDLPTRIQLLFDWDDGFERGTWDRGVWRQWTRECYDAIASRHGRTAATYFRAQIGRYAAEKGYITILPKYEGGKAGKSYQTARPGRVRATSDDEDDGDSPPLLWSVSLPVAFPGPVRGLRQRVDAVKLSDDQIAMGWELVTQATSRGYRDRMERFVRLHKSRIQGRWLPGIRRVAGDPDPQRDGEHEWRILRSVYKGYDPRERRSATPNVDREQDAQSDSPASGPSFGETDFSEGEP